MTAAQILIGLVDEGKACTKHFFTALGNETWSIQRCMNSYIIIDEQLDCEGCKAHPQVIDSKEETLTALNGLIL